MPTLAYIVLCLALVGACIRPLGGYMARVYSNHPVRLERFLGIFERLIYRFCGIDPSQEFTWRGYAGALLVLGVAGIGLLLAIFCLQGVLPLNPQKAGGLSFDLAFNAAVSFVTNTNWQSYSGEAQLSYFSQMAGVAVQNFLSAATGMAVAAALCRGLARKQAQTLGNPYVDVVRGILYILLPLSLVFALFFASQGVVQNFSPYTPYKTFETGADALIAQGPAASQVAIKMLGSNGGGFFNANGAHPFENPTPFSELVSLVAMLLIPVSFAYTFGVMVGDRRQGWVLIAAMMIIFLPMLALGVASEETSNPQFDPKVIDSSLGNMEGKEMRFGVSSSVFWAAATTATSNGSVNSMHDSYTPLGGLVPLMLIQFEVVFGGAGSGVYGILMFVLLTVFIGGLMVGRTPEYLGKKLGTFEIKMASVVMVVPGALMLAGAAIASATEAGRAGIFNPGAQGFTEILYAYASASNNNGSAFAGIAANTPFYNTTLALCMLLGRYLLIIPVLALAGSLAAKKTVPVSAGTLPTHTPLFTFMLCFIILLNLLTYLPSLALGPVVEHLHSPSVSLP
jgi:potassium-transporting ATPase potassium-binding subunit